MARKYQHNLSMWAVEGGNGLPSRSDLPGDEMKPSTYHIMVGTIAAITFLLYWLIGLMCDLITSYENLHAVPILPAGSY